MFNGTVRPAEVSGDRDLRIQKLYAFSCSFILVLESRLSVELGRWNGRILRCPPLTFSDSLIAISASADKVFTTNSSWVDHGSSLPLRHLFSDDMRFQHCSGTYRFLCLASTSNLLPNQVHEAIHQLRMRTAQRAPFHVAQ